MSPRAHPAPSWDITFTVEGSGPSVVSAEPEVKLNLGPHALAHIGALLGGHR